MLFTILQKVFISNISKLYEKIYYIHNLLKFLHYSYKFSFFFKFFSTRTINYYITTVTDSDSQNKENFNISKGTNVARIIPRVSTSKTFQPKIIKNIKSDILEK